MYALAAIFTIPIHPPSHGKDEVDRLNAVTKRYLQCCMYNTANPTPDSSIGFYSRPGYDDDGDQTSCAVLSIVELKKPGIALGADERALSRGVGNHVLKKRKKSYKKV